MPADAAERTYFPVPDNEEPLIAIAKDKEQQVPIIYIFHKHEAFPNDQKGNVGYLAVNYMSSMIANMLNARLNEIMQKPNPPFIQALAEDGDYSQRRRYFRSNRSFDARNRTCPSVRIHSQ